MKHYKKEDHKVYMREVWYPKNKQKHINAVRISRERLKKFINEIKNVPCADCKNEYPPYVMDFDHTANDKTFNVAILVQRGNRKQALEEIKKCEIVCANCHRIRTWNRRTSSLNSGVAE